ncbi:protein MON2-like [Oopsacas minuta]|uniref:Protein MON2-like n=1 Tax=Oopsacas minuta TaxID=111878 RepID=A0AAV7K000_9METZ|nr:protein MON2-like [Oopsacas minuta]
MAQNQALQNSVKVGVNPKEFIESLQQDLRNLSVEAKKKYPNLREPLERGIMQLHEISIPTESFDALKDHVAEIVIASIMGIFDTKVTRLVYLGLQCIQRLLTANSVNKQSLQRLTALLAELAITGPEEVKVIQTLLQMVSTDLRSIQGSLLSKSLRITILLLSNKDPIVSNTASTALRQIVLTVFEWASTEDMKDISPKVSSDIKPRTTPTPGINVLPQLTPHAQDAHSLFRDLCQLTSGDPPFWLDRDLSLNKELGLELIESVLLSHKSLFFLHSEFSWLLTECASPLLIKLFSLVVTTPKIQSSGLLAMTSVLQSGTGHDMKALSFSIYVRLFRLLHILVNTYHPLLMMECEIFFSLLQRFIEQNSQLWQTSLALEVVRRFCIKSELLVALCKYYDMQPKSAQVFGNLIASMSHSFETMVREVVQQGGSGQLESIGQINKIPLLGSNKQSLLEMMDKPDPPHLSESYGCAVCLSAFDQLIRSFGGLYGEELNAKKSANSLESHEHVTNNEHTRKDANIISVLTAMITATWFPILNSFNLVIDQFIEEGTIESVLQCKQTFIYLTASLPLEKPRNYFVLSHCNWSLPPGVPKLPLTTEITNLATKLREFRHNTDENLFIPQVSAQRKHLQCLRSLLTLAHVHGSVLGLAWYPILCTLQEVYYYYNLEAYASAFSRKEQLQPQIVPHFTTTTLREDFIVLQQLMLKLFDSSQFLNDQALTCLLQALCRLCTESLVHIHVIPSSQNENPRLFCITKIQQVCSANLFRSNLFWENLSGHLLTACQSPNQLIASAAGESFIELIRNAIEFSHHPALDEQKELQRTFMQSFLELSLVQNDRHFSLQLSSLNVILQQSITYVNFSWDIILSILTYAASTSSTAIVKLGYRNLQYIIADCLPVITVEYHTVVILTTAMYGRQEVEINTSFSAVGQLWNLADYFFQDWKRIQSADHTNSFEKNAFLNNSTDTISTPIMRFLQNNKLVQIGTNSALSWGDNLWMTLFLSLGQLCVDDRGTVRRSAAQSLFATLETHGELLSKPESWSHVFWELIFPLVDEMKLAIETARTTPEYESTVIIHHHSRDTAHKQWAETLALVGMQLGRLIKARWGTLVYLTDFAKIWTAYLGFVEFCCLKFTPEVAFQTLQSFRDILLNGVNYDESSQSIHLSSQHLDVRLDEAYTQAWSTWIQLAKTKIPSMLKDIEIATDRAMLPEMSHFHAVVINLVKLGPALFIHVKSSLQVSHISQLFQLIRTCVQCPVERDVSPFLVPSPTEDIIAHLHECILHTIHIILIEKLTTQSILCFEATSLMSRKTDWEDSLLNITISNEFKLYIPLILKELFFYCTLIHQPLAIQIPSDLKSYFMDVNYYPFFKVCLRFLKVLLPLSLATSMAYSVFIPECMPSLEKLIPLRYQLYTNSMENWENMTDMLLLFFKCCVQYSLELNETLKSTKTSINLSLLELFSLIESTIFEITPIDSTKQYVLDSQRKSIQIIDLLLRNFENKLQELPFDVSNAYLNLLIKGAFLFQELEFEIERELSYSCLDAFLASTLKAQPGTFSNRTFKNLIDISIGKLSLFPKENIESEEPLVSEQEMVLILQLICRTIQSVNELLSRNKSKQDQNSKAIVALLSRIYIPLTDCCTVSSLKVRETLKITLQQLASWIIFSGTNSYLSISSQD